MLSVIWGGEILTLGSKIDFSAHQKMSPSCSKASEIPRVLPVSSRLAPWLNPMKKPPHLNETR